MAKVLEYKKIKQICKFTFKDATKNPEKYFEDQQTQQLIRNASKIEKDVLWQNFKHSASKKFLKSHGDCLSDDAKEIISKKTTNSKVKIIDSKIGTSIVKGLKESHIKISAKNIKNLIKHPEKYKELDKLIFHHIKSLSEEEKNDLFTQIVKESHIDINDEALPYHNSDIVNFFYKLIKGMSQTFHEIKNKLIDVAVGTLTTIIEEKLGDDIGSEVLGDLVEGAGDALKTIGEPEVVVGGASSPSDAGTLE